MIKKLLQKITGFKKTTSGPKVEGVVSPEAKKPNKKRAWVALIFIVCGSVGFAGSSYYFQTKRVPHIDARNSLTALPKSNIGSNEWLSGQPLETPAQPSAAQKKDSVVKNDPPAQAQVAVKKSEPPSQLPIITKKTDKPEAVKSPVTEGRDVFKDFYKKGVLSDQAPKTHNKGKDLTELTKVITGNTGIQDVSPVRVVNTVPIAQPKEIKILGMTCLAECIALTSDGPLKRGDKIGDEIVTDVTSRYLATTKRTVEYR